MVEMLNAGIVREKYKIGFANSQNCQLSSSVNTTLLS